MKPNAPSTPPEATSAFSILERIDVGETHRVVAARSRAELSVSSNGSTWVKHCYSQ